MQEFLQLANLGVQIYKLFDTNSGSSILEVLKVVDANLKELNIQNENLKLKINKLTNKNAELKREKLDAQTELSKILEAWKIIKKQTNRINTENENLNLKVEELRRKNSQLEKEKSDLEARIASISQTWKVMNANLKDLSIQNESLNLRVVQLTDETDQFRQERSKIESKISAMTENVEELENLKKFLFPRDQFEYHKKNLYVIKKFKKIESIYKGIQKIKREYQMSLSNSQLSRRSITQLQGIQNSEDYWDVVMFFCQDNLVRTYIPLNYDKEYEKYNYFAGDYNRGCENLYCYYDRLFDEDWDNLNAVRFFEEFYFKVESFVWECAWEFIRFSEYIDIDINSLDAALSKTKYLFAELKIFSEEDVYPVELDCQISWDNEDNDIPF